MRSAVNKSCSRMPAARAIAICACALLKSGVIRISSAIASLMALRALARRRACLARSKAPSNASTTGFASISIGMLFRVELEFEDQIAPAHQILRLALLLAVIFRVDGEASAGGRIHIKVRAFGKGFDQHVSTLVGQGDFHSADVLGLSLDLEYQLDRKLGRDLEQRLALIRADPACSVSGIALLVDLRRLDLLRRLQRVPGKHHRECH